ncbi:MAG: hypothetical protein ACOYI2_02290 [Bacillota bacterium]|jgi:hypothetical protein|nr:hypothetical protein [Clostridia bacterium]
MNNILSLGKTTSAKTIDLRSISMKKYIRIILPILFLALAVPVIFRYQSKAPPPNPSYWLVDTATNRTLTHTSTFLSVGDEYISADNQVYRIIRIHSDKAYAERID